MAIPGQKEAYPSSNQVKFKGRLEINVDWQRCELAAQPPADDSTALVQHLHPRDQLHHGLALQSHLCLVSTRHLL